MRLVSIHNCTPGMKLGKAIHTNDGKTLLGYGYELTEAIINRLFQLGILQVYIEDPRTDDIPVEETLNDSTRIQVYASLKNCLQYVRAGGRSYEWRLTTFSKLISESVTLIISDVLKGQNRPIVHISHTAPVYDSIENHFFHNALNVAVYASKLALLQGVSMDELRTVCAAALFHDIGKLLVPEELLAKSAALSEEEMKEIRRHTELGYKALKEDGSVSLVAAQCALQHHERIDGLGYPYGLSGANIHPYAQLIGMIDAYDALISPRSYRDSMLPHEAIDFLYAHAGTMFDSKLVELFRNNVAIFPPGTAVTLTTGEQGVVSRLDLSNLQRPTVRVLTNRLGEVLKSPYELHLSKHLHVMIRSVNDRQKRLATTSN